MWKNNSLHFRNSWVKCNGLCCAGCLFGLQIYESIKSLLWLSSSTSLSPSVKTWALQRAQELTHLDLGILWVEVNEIEFQRWVEGHEWRTWPAELSLLNQWGLNPCAFADLSCSSIDHKEKWSQVTESSITEYMLKSALWTAPRQVLCRLQGTGIMCCLWDILLYKHSQILHHLRFQKGLSI